MKLHVHTLTMVIYIQYKFHEIPSIGYLVMAEDGKTDGRKHRQNDAWTLQNQYPSAFGGN